jgi:hypothetical protein
MGVAYNTSIVTDSLVTYIDFASTKSSPKTGTSPVTISDLSANNINWTTQNACTIGPNSLTTDGINGYVYSNNTNYETAWSPSAGTLGGSSLTVELVFNSSDTAGNLISRNWNGSGEYNYRMTSNQFFLVVASAGASVTHANICTGANVHMTWWMNATQYGVYQNGQELVSPTNHGLTGAGSTTYGSGANGTLIGSLYPYGQGWSGNTGFSIAGSFYLCRMYNRVLSASEVLQNFNATRGRFGI